MLDTRNQRGGRKSEKEVSKLLQTTMIFLSPVNKTISEDDQELILKETIKQEEQPRSGAFDVLGDDNH